VRTPRKSGIYGCINHALPLLRERRKFAILVNDLLRFGIPIAAAATGQVKSEATAPRVLSDAQRSP